MSDDQIQKYKAKLASDFPEIAIGSVKHIGTGWHHVALEVNNTIIFRLPREVHVKDLSSTVAYEMEILLSLQNKLPIAIPDPQFMPPDRSYFGYPKLKGNILEDLITDFEDDDWERLMGDWVNVASSIHQFVTIEQARRFGVPDFDGFDTNMAERIFDLKVDGAVQDFAHTVIQQVKSLDRDNQHWVFIHNDLQGQNFLADPKSKRITGLIDWTDVCIAPIAREFATGEWIQKGLLEDVARLYEQRTGITIDIAQARMWRAIEELSDYVEEVEGDESKEAAETLKRIEQLAVTGS